MYNSQNLFDFTLKRKNTYEKNNFAEVSKNLTADMNIENNFVGLSK